HGSKEIRRPMGIQTKRSQRACRGGSGGEASGGVNRPFEAQHEPCHCRYPGLGVAKIAHSDQSRRPLRRSGEARYLRHLDERGDRPQNSWASSLFFCSINVRPPANVGKASPRLKPLVLFYGPTLPRGPTFSKS